MCVFACFELYPSMGSLVKSLLPLLRYNCPNPTTHNYAYSWASPGSCGQCGLTYCLPSTSPRNGLMIYASHPHAPVIILFIYLFIQQTFFFNVVLHNVIRMNGDTVRLLHYSTSPQGIQKVFLNKGQLYMLLWPEYAPKLLSQTLT